ncbi:SMC-Scp complex subunit ScpB [Candidatus Woesearchaeota archaeon]|nr:MAG: SMC-Scp complex subunit ScpB [Candidatus Woesearchaeota archaeon]
MQKNDLKNKIEALLFSSGKFMTEENLSLLIGADIREVKKTVRDLEKEYAERDHSLMLVQEGDSWKINVRELYLDLVRKIVADTELPKGVLETLAVIAWKSPILQSEVVRIRSNKAYEHIAQLEEMGFVIKDKFGRSFKIKVTEKFFEYFDVSGKNLKEVFKDAKMPEKQATLDGQPEEVTPSDTEQPEPTVEPEKEFADEVEKMQEEEIEAEETPAQEKEPVKERTKPVKNREEAEDEEKETEGSEEETEVEIPKQREKMPEKKESFKEATRRAPPKMEGKIIKTAKQKVPKKSIREVEKSGKDKREEEKIKKGDKTKEKKIRLQEKTLPLKKAKKNSKSPKKIIKNAKSKLPKVQKRNVIPAKKRKLRR